MSANNTGSDDVPAVILELGCPQADEDAFRAVYGAHGACILRGLVAPDGVAALDNEAQRLLSCFLRDEIPATHVSGRLSVTGGEIFERIDPVCECSPLFGELAESPELRRFADAAVGGRAALLKDKLIYKHPGDAGYGLHQDYPYFYECDVPADAVTILMIAIDPMRPANGCLRIYPGYHRVRLQAPPGRPRDTAPEAVCPERRRDVILEPGDGVFFHVLTPHDSGPNLTAGTRRALFFTYTTGDPAGMREAYYRHRRGLGQGGLFR